MRVFLILFIFLSACADPTYIRPEEGGAGAFDKMRYDCALMFNSEGPCITWSWETKPKLKEEGSFYFRFYRASGLDSFPVSVMIEDEVKIELYMPDMGHGSTPVNVEPVSGEPGLFRASEVNFLGMDGLWEIRFQIFNNGNKTGEVVDQIHFIF